jgi:hypothetical protein
MATTVHITNFENKVIDLLTGISTATTPIGYINAYNGAQAADPSVAPAGTFVFATVSQAPNLNTKMTFAGQGVSQLSTVVPPTTPGGAATVSTITTARIFTTSQLPILDVTATLVGGGGGIILNTLNSLVGVGYNVDAFAIKLPLNNGGTLSWNAALVDRMINMWAGTSAVSPEMGKNTNGQCLFQVYSGAAPASADLPATGTLLVSTALGGTNIWATASGGSAALVSNPSSLAVGTGTAGYARMVKSYGSLTFIIQGSVGTAATDFVISTTSITSGVTTVDLNEATLSI